MLQYTGFIAAGGSREYNFSLFHKGDPDRSFTVSISGALFRPGLLKYQEGPGICYSKLLVALKAEVLESLVDARQSLTQSEVEMYLASGRPKARAWTEEERLQARQRFKANLKAHH